MINIKGCEIKMEEKLLNEWQERLGLTDWAIVLKCNCNLDEMELDNSAGETRWTNCNKTAIIRIMSKENYGNDRILAFDFERILVHELLHIKFSYLQLENNTYESKVLDETIHQLIDDLARAFVMTKRNQTKRKLNCKKVEKNNGI